MTNITPETEMFDGCRSRSTEISKVCFQKTETLKKFNFFSKPSDKGVFPIIASAA